MPGLQVPLPQAEQMGNQGQWPRDAYGAPLFLAMFCRCHCFEPDIEQIKPNSLVSAEKFMDIAVIALTFSQVNIEIEIALKRNRNNFEFEFNPFEELVRLEFEKGRSK